MKPFVLVACGLMPVLAHADEMTFKEFQDWCRDDGGYTEAGLFCHGYLLGMASQLINEERYCVIHPDSLGSTAYVGDGTLLSARLKIRAADIYGYPKQARLAVAKILEEEMVCSDRE